MLFNSLTFFIFLVAVFLVYWLLNRKSQNLWLLVSSYFFYAWWDWRFLFLILFSSLVDFFSGKLIDKSNDPKKRKMFLVISLISNLGLLGFFKYFNFFIDSFQSLLMSFGFPESSLFTLTIILPVGISFYTFQSMTYTIDIYRKKMKHTENIISFLSYVSFFPQLVAGPIERAKNLLPQFLKNRSFDIPKIKDGLRQILWGLFKKIVIADSLAIVVTKVYSNVGMASGWELLIATLFFSFQIYCDFSGYSDIAIGSARLFGFDLSRNFFYPYFSRNIVEFWHRWHITLSKWFRDYVFIPLGGSRVEGKLRYFMNIMITFIISGLWHGANWTFIMWGSFHGLLYTIFVGIGGLKNKKTKNLKTRKIFEIPYILITFLFVAFLWIFFRTETITDSFVVIYKIFSGFSLDNIGFIYPKRWFIIVALIIVEWFGQNRNYALAMVDRYPIMVRWSVYYAIIIAIIILGVFEYKPFIYFQF